VLLLPSLVTVLAGCGDGNPVAPAPATPVRATLAPGQSVVVPGTAYAVRFEGVPEDSRCPGDALCIDAGNAIVAITVRSPATARGLLLHTARPDPVGYDGLTIALDALAPYPFSSLPPIRPNDYRATLVISR